jgi:ribosome recycling factor
MDDVIKNADSRFGKAVDALKKNFAAIRTGRATPALLDHVMVDYYGTPTPLAQLGQLANPEARTIVITPYDKSALKAIEQALREMPNLDANPQNDGNLIRVVLPDLTEERRKEYVKLVKAKAEDARVAIRNIRRKGNDDLAALKKDGLAGDDEITRAEKELDTATKTHVDAVDDALKRKEAELLEV